MAKKRNDFNVNNKNKFVLLSYSCSTIKPQRLFRPCVGNMHKIT